jgi:hypothetical protein
VTAQNEFAALHSAICLPERVVERLHELSSGIINCCLACLKG